MVAVIGPRRDHLHLRTPFAWDINNEKLEADEERVEIISASLPPPEYPWPLRTSDPTAGSAGPVLRGRCALEPSRRSRSSIHSWSSFS